MNVAEAKARIDGIDFYINKKNITICASRNENGEISIVQSNIINQKEKFKISDRLLALFFTIMYLIVKSFIENFGDYRIKVLSFFAFIWLAIITRYLIRAVNPKNEQIFKYHAAEHKVLNYWDIHEKVTLDCNEVRQMNSISIRCGSTIIAVVLVLITICMLGILFIPWIVLKIIWCVVSVFVTFLLWATGKCDFLQKMVIREPGIEEIEVAVQGMFEYIKVKNEE